MHNDQHGLINRISTMGTQHFSVCSSFQHNLGHGMPPTVTIDCLCVYAQCDVGDFFCGEYTGFNAHRPPRFLYENSVSRTRFNQFGCIRFETNQIKFIYGGGGGCWSKNCFAHFSTVISLYIYYDQYEKIWRKNRQNIFSAVGLHGNGGHIRF